MEKTVFQPSLQPSNTIPLAPSPSAAPLYSPTVLPSLRLPDLESVLIGQDTQDEFPLGDTDAADTAKNRHRSIVQYRGNKAVKYKVYENLEDVTVD